MPVNGIRLHFWLVQAAFLAVELHQVQLSTYRHKTGLVEIVPLSILYEEALWFIKANAKIGGL